MFDEQREKRERKEKRRKKKKRETGKRGKRIWRLGDVLINLESESFRRFESSCIEGVILARVRLANDEDTFEGEIWLKQQVRFPSVVLHFPSFELRRLNMRRMIAIPQYL